MSAAGIMLTLYFTVLGFLLVNAEQISDDSLLKRFEALEKRVLQQDAIIAQQRAEIAMQKATDDKHTEKIKSLSKQMSIVKEECRHPESQGVVSKRFVYDEGPVTFTALISRGIVDHVRDQSTIIFPTVVTSYGGGYSNLTGVFVAPITGIYMFSCSLLDHIGDNPDIAGQPYGSAMLHAEIVLEGKTLGRIFARAEIDYRDQGSVTVFSYVTEGQQVWVRNIDNDDLGLGGDHYSVFSGYLMTLL